MAAVGLVRATTRAVAVQAAMQVVVQQTIRAETAMPVAAAMVALVETVLVRQVVQVAPLRPALAVLAAVVVQAVETGVAETVQPAA